MTSLSELKMESKVPRCVFWENNHGIESYEFSGANLKAKGPVRYLWYWSVSEMGKNASLPSGHTPGP